MNEEANLTRQSTPVGLRNSEDNVMILSKPTCPRIVLQPAKRTRSRTQSRTGLDGPLSSNSDRVSKALRDDLSDLKESSRSAGQSASSQKLRSNTSGSIDWEKSWYKRKPRRKHDVSEASNLRLISPPNATHLFPAAHDHNNHQISDSSDGEDDVSDGKSCSYLSQHDAQFHAIQRNGLHSCPELHRQLDEFDRSLSKLKTRENQEQTSQSRPELDQGRHRHFHIRNIVTKRFRSLGQKLRHSGSSNFSIRSEFPATPDSRERRLLARDSADIWPSSGAETPLYNTPESDITFTRATGHHIDPLAIAGMMIATAELDRLSSRASLDQLSRTSGSSTGLSGSSPISYTPLHSGVTSPDNETSASELATIDMPPTMPFNTPASSASQSGIGTPVSRPSQRRGHRRRGQRSRLSEVTTPDEVASPAESAEESVERHFSISSQIDTLPECSSIANGGNDDNLYPKPLAINRGDSESPGSPSGQATHPLPLIGSGGPGSPQASGDSKKLNVHEEISAPTRVSSIGKTPGPTCDQKAAEDVKLWPAVNIPLNVRHAALSSTDQTDMKAPRIPTEMYIFQRSSAITMAVDDMSTMTLETVDTLAMREPKERTTSDSCHPDTWSESQGEPGNSDPFCPPDCLKSGRSSQDSHFRPSFPTRRQGSSETVRRLEVFEKPVSNGDDSSQKES